MYYDEIPLGEVIKQTKTKNSDECIVCHYWYFNHRFIAVFTLKKIKSQNSLFFSWVWREIRTRIKPVF